MPNRKQKLSKKQRFLLGHPYCCFCGGSTPATTSDHVPPKACFPDGFCPDDFEFPACANCNRGTKREDQIFGFYAMLVDFNEGILDRAYARKLRKLREGIANNYPEALPDALIAQPVSRIGRIATPRPVAVEVSTPRAFHDAANCVGRKLTHALYYRERGRAISRLQHFTIGCHQIQRSATAPLTACFANLLPDFVVGSRTNIKSYGERFAYKSGVKEDEDFFVYAAQFGRGLIVWGIVLGPGMALKDVPEPLSRMPWCSGGITNAKPLGI